MMMLLLKSWQRAWSALNACGDGQDHFQQLLESYSEKQRKYHTLQHLSECIRNFEAGRMLAEHPGEIEMALWFHDGIYVLTRRDNEAESAVWAEAVLLDSRVNAVVAGRVRNLVMATCHSALPSTFDEQLLVDIDLAILGASKSRFDEYECRVKKEYAWVPEKLFKSERTMLLNAFLMRPHIFNTEFFRKLYEERARRNLQRSVARLCD